MGIPMGEDGGSAADMARGGNDVMQTPAARGLTARTGRPFYANEVVSGFATGVGVEGSLRENLGEGKVPSYSNPGPMEPPTADPIDLNTVRQHSGATGHTVNEQTSDDTPQQGGRHR